MIKRIIAYLLAVVVLSGGFILPAYGADAISGRDVQFAITDADSLKICNNDMLSFSLNLKNSEMKSKSFHIAYVITNSDDEIAVQGSFDVTVPAKTVKSHPYSLRLPGYDTYGIDVTVSLDDEVLVHRSAEFAYMKKNTDVQYSTGISTQINNGWDDDAKTIPQMKDAGFGIVRDSIKWRNADNGDGTYTVPESDMEWIDRANECGMKVILLAWNPHPDYNDGSLPTSEEDLAELKSYSAQIAEQLKGKIWAYEVWNEPNNAELSTNSHTTTGTQYAAVLKAVYEGIRSVDEETLVIGGALTPVWSEKKQTITYLRQMMNAGAGNYMDGFSFHPYSYDNGAYYDEGITEDNLDTQVDYVRGILADEYGFEKGIYITEIGASTHDNALAGSVSGVGEWEQAVSLSRAATMAETNEHVEAALFYTWLEKSANPAEAAWGIISVNYGNAKPAYAALSFRNYILGGIEDRKKIEQGVYSYNKKNGGSVFALWSEKDKSESVNIIKTGNKVEFASNTIRCPEDYVVKAYDMYGNIIDGDTIPVTEAPVYVSCMPKSEANISLSGENVMVSGIVSDKEQPITVVAYEIGNSSPIYINQVYATSEGTYETSFPIDSDTVTAVAVFDGEKKKMQSLSRAEGLEISFYNGDTEILSPDEINDGLLNVKVKTTSTQELMAIAAVYGSDGALFSVDLDTVSNAYDGFLNVEMKEDFEFCFMLWDMNMSPKLEKITSK